MHAFASADPVFLALNRRMQRETKGALGNFCVQCHAPLAAKSGATKDGLDLGELDPRLLGIGCLACHGAEYVGGPLHNNSLTLASDLDMRGSYSDPVANPVHASRYSPGHDATHDAAPVFCGACHDIENPRGVAVERTFAEWSRSHFALEGTGSCGTCHMPARTDVAAVALGAGPRVVHDHSMVGVDVASLSFPEKDAQRSRIEKSLSDALSATLCVSEDAQAVRLDVSLRNVKVGHSWPSGAGQDRRAWVEIEAFSKGASVFSSGKVADDAAVRSLVDPQMFLLRDTHFDERGDETAFLWNTTRVESLLVPAASSSRAPAAESERKHAYTFVGSLPDRVTMRVKIRPVDLDLLAELVRSGDLAPELARTTPTFTLGSTELVWTGERPCVSTP